MFCCQLRDQPVLPCDRYCHCEIRTKLKDIPSCAWHSKFYFRVHPILRRCLCSTAIGPIVCLLEWRPIARFYHFSVFSGNMQCNLRKDWYIRCKTHSQGSYMGLVDRIGVRGSATSTAYPSKPIKSLILKACQMQTHIMKLAPKEHGWAYAAQEQGPLFVWFQGMIFNFFNLGSVSFTRFTLRSVTCAHLAK